jgi:hypothetical protein
MRRRHLELLGRVARQRLDLQQRAVRDQAAAVEALETALGRLAAEVEGECLAAGADPRCLPALLGYLSDRRDRSARLEEDLTAARGELESRTDQARELYLEGRRYERLLERAALAGRRAESRLERRFLDWLGERHSHRRKPG